MKVYTYFVPVPEIEKSGQEDLIALWKKSWENHGWQPVILGEDDAKKSEFYTRILDNVFEFPTSNPRAYEVACFLRWAAMEHVLKTEIGGVMTDYDCINYGFTPKMIDLKAFPLHSGEGHIPCCVYGHQKAFKLVCQIFSNYQRSRHETQVSDMTILERSAYLGIFRHTNQALQYTVRGWEEALLNHFSSHCLRSVEGKSKAEKIQKIRPVK